MAQKVADASQPPSKPPNNSLAAKLLVNLAPGAAFRKGRPSTKEELRLEPELEAHLCQLAAFENYADHGMVIKFSDAEASSLESRALDMALDESNAVEEARKSGLPPSQVSSRASSKTLSRAEAEELLARLRSDDDPLFSDVATSIAAGEEPPAAARPAAATSVVSTATVAPPPKVSSFSAFKRKLLPKIGRSRKTEHAPVPRASNELPPGTLGYGYSPGSYDHFAAEAADNGMEYSNGYIFPKDYVHDEEADWGAGTKQDGVKDLEDERLERALAISKAHSNNASAEAETNGHEEDLLAVAMQESKQQAEFDRVLRDAKMLRQDLQHEQGRCAEKQRHLEAQKAHLDARLARVSGRQGPPPHLERERAEAGHNAREAASRSKSLGEAVGELRQLEAFIRSTKPSRDEAVSLSEAIVRELLERLNFQGFDFFVPPAHKADASKDVADILARYRRVNPLPPSPAKSVQASPARSAPSPKSTASEPPPTPPQVLGEVSATDSPQQSDAGEVEHRVKVPTASPAPPLRPSAFAAVAPPVAPADSTAASSPQAPSTPVKANGVPLAVPDTAATEPQTPASTATEQTSVSDEDLKLQTSVTKASQRLQHLTTPPAKIDKAKPAASTPPKPASRTSSVRSARSSSFSMDRLPSVGSLKGWDDRLKGPVGVKRSSQVVHLFNELRKILPDVMDLAYALPPPVEVGRQLRDAAPAPQPTPEVLTAAKAEADLNSRTITKLASQVSRAKPKTMAAACELVEDVETELAVLRTEPSAVLSHFPDWPKAKWTALKEASSTAVELNEMGNCMSDWTMKGTYEEESVATEMFFDDVRVRYEALQRRIRDAEKRWAAAGVSWDAGLPRHCRLAALHIATTFLSRALIEVANLERGQVLRAQACTGVLADASRVAFKVHQFVGGFHSDAIELFDKVKRLAQFYVRSRDPTWLRDTSKLTR